MTLVVFEDADGVEFPINVVGSFETTQDAVNAANGLLTKAIWEGTLNPRKPIRVKDGAVEWGGQF
jgi:hypothetical protein